MMTHRQGTWLLVLIAVGALVQSYLESPLRATTIALISLSCPVCNNRFDGYTLTSTNSFGGQDRDFLTRAVGEQPLVIVAQTCPKCFYSGYQRDFTAQVQIPDTVKEQILKKKMLKPMTPIAEGAEPRETPAYVKYDLIAQTYQLRGQTDEVIAMQLLNASWATRVQSDLPETILGGDLMKKVRNWTSSQQKLEETARQENPALYRIQKGKEYEKAARSLEGEPRMIAALAAVATLRQYGEYTETRSALSVLRTVMPGEQYSRLERLTDDSIAREQGFQSRALALFEKVIPTKQDAEEKASLVYLCGELHRRLGNWDKARSCYGQCLAIEGRPDWLEPLAKEQRGLLPK